eukprot:1137381-Pelagomonas_calceolata.AAC.2
MKGQPATNLHHYEHAYARSWAGRPAAVPGDSGSCSGKCTAGQAGGGGAEERGATCLPSEWQRLLSSFPPGMAACSAFDVCSASCGSLASETDHFLGCVGDLGSTCVQPRWATQNPAQLLRSSSGTGAAEAASNNLTNSSRLVRC